MKIILSSILIAGALVSGAALRTVNAEEIAIINSSFEEPLFGDGAFNETTCRAGWGLVYFRWPILVTIGFLALRKAASCPTLWMD